MGVCLSVCFLLTNDRCNEKNKLEMGIGNEGVLTFKWDGRRWITSWQAKSCGNSKRKEKMQKNFLRFQRPIEATRT